MPTCGNCKQHHNTAVEVRACYGQAQQPAPAATTTETYGRGSTTNAVLSDRQRDFLERLLEERPSYVASEGYTPERVARLTRSEASRLIDHLTNDVPRENLRDPEPRVPEGRYALPATTGADDHMVFYQVDKPTTGKWAGRVFVALLVGAPGDFSRTNVPRAQQAAVLDRIAVNPAEAALRFSRKFQVCARCLSALSTVRSRGTGFGPVCSDHLGVRYLPYDEALQLLNEQGISKEGLEDLAPETLWDGAGFRPAWHTVVLQSQLIHPDWTIDEHVEYLRVEEGVDVSTIDVLNFLGALR